MHRLSAVAHRTLTVAPAWSVDKRGMHNKIHRELIQRDAWHGPGSIQSLNFGLAYRACPTKEQNFERSILD